MFLYRFKLKLQINSFLNRDEIIYSLENQKGEKLENDISFKKIIFYIRARFS